MTTRYRDITLHLNDVRELFVDPDFDPLDADCNYVSGLEQIITAVTARDLRAETIRATIYLPAEKLQPDLEPKLKDAVARFSRFQIERRNAELISTRWQGVKALQIGLLFLAACLFLAESFRTLESLPEPLRAFLSEGFTIAGWVSLWNPIELFLYAWWPDWRARQIYRYIMKLEIIVKARP